MPLDPELRRELLDRLPDEPRNVETRGALLAGEAAIFGSPTGCVARMDGQRLLSVVGDARESDLRAAIACATGDWTLICPLERGRRWAGALPGWSLEAATLHTLPDAVEEIGVETGGALVERVSSPSPGWLDHAPDRLRREIGAVAGRYPLFAAWVDGRAVSFCYAAFPTETLWDVSVDTLRDYRRRGLAAACFARAFEALSETGRRPVWGAVDSNVASLRLAERLGFRPAGKLAVLEGRLD